MPRPGTFVSALYVHRSRRLLQVSAILMLVILVWAAQQSRGTNPTHLGAIQRQLSAGRAGRITMPVRLAYIKGLSKRFTKALGRAEVDYEAGTVAVAVTGLDSLPPGSKYEVWLIEHGAGAANSVALDLGQDGDKILSLGTFPLQGSEVFAPGSEALRQLEIDMVAVMRVGPGMTPEQIVAGMPSVFESWRVEATLKSRRGVLDWVVAPVKAADGTDALIRQGESIFFTETFNGNGRTCGTCHPSAQNFILNPGDIQTLAATDPTNPLFVSENNPDFLPPGFFEDPPRMRLFSHILENLDGFDEICEFPDTDDGNPFTSCLSVADVKCTASGCQHPQSKSVRRAIPTIINTGVSGPFGLGGNVLDLQAFCVGAVVQHFPITMNRVAGADFRPPTVRELRAMEAFMRSRVLPTNVGSPGFDPFALADTPAKIRGAALFQAGATGPVIGGSAGRCTACHLPPALGNTVNFDTGVNGLAFSLLLPFDDGGANSGGTCGSDLVLRRSGTCNGGSFNVPQLMGIGATAPFFHNGSAASLRDAVQFYISTQFVRSPGGRFVRVLTGGSIVLNAQNIDDIVAFLEGLVEPVP